MLRYAIVSAFKGHNVAQPLINELTAIVNARLEDQTQPRRPRQILDVAGDDSDGTETQIIAGPILDNHSAEARANRRAAVMALTELGARAR